MPRKTSQLNLNFLEHLGKLLPVTPVLELALPMCRVQGIFPSSSGIVNMYFKVLIRKHFTSELWHTKHPTATECLRHSEARLGLLLALWSALHGADSEKSTCPNFHLCLFEKKKSKTKIDVAVQWSAATKCFTGKCVDSKAELRHEKQNHSSRQMTRSLLALHSGKPALAPHLKDVIASINYKSFFFSFEVFSCVFLPC